MERFKGKRIAVLLDDLPEYARQNEAAFVLTAIARLRDLCRPLVVVATSRTGADQEVVEREFGSLLERGYTLTLEPMDARGAEGQAFLRAIAAADVTLYEQSFDGTPGSALLDLERRTELLRNQAFPAGALAVLEALALLRRAQTYTFREGRVRRVAHGVFDLPAAGTAWTQALETLLTDGWVRLDRASGSGESTLRLPTDAYLDTCMAARYPLPGRRIEDDFPRLLTALSGPPTDADALFPLADALSEDPLGAKAAQGELALEAVKHGLAALDPERDAALWARGQGTLGLAYADRIQGARADNLEQALAAYQAALCVYTRDAFPIQWAATQNNLGAAYADRIQGARADNLERALAAYQAALSVRTRDAFPAQWAKTTYNVALLRVAQGEEARQRGDRAGCRTQQTAALEAMRSTLTVYTAEGFPDNHAAVVKQIARIQALRCDDVATDGE